MKRVIRILILPLVLSVMLSGCERNKGSAEDIGSSAGTRNRISEEIVYEGVYNYCHSMYDWSIAKDNPDIMVLQMGEETESEYQVIFRSYTGTFVYFYVDKSSAETRMVEYVPALGIEEEAGAINLYDYLESAEKSD